MLGRVTGQKYGSSDIGSNILGIPLEPFRTFASGFAELWWVVLPIAVTIPVMLSIQRRNRRQLRDRLFLLFWLTVVLIFFGRFGNHPWYYIPALASAALLISIVLDEAINNSKAAIIGVGLSAVLSLVLGIQGESYLFIGRVTVSAVLIGIIAIALFYEPVAHSLSKSDLQLARVIISALLVIMIVVGMVGAPLSGGWKYTEQTKNMGIEINQNTPQDATVYIAHETTKQTPLFSIQFYADRALSDASIEQINSDNTIRYILTGRSRLSEISRDCTVVHSYENNIHKDLIFVQCQ